MPTTRKRVTRKIAKMPLSEDLKVYLLSGERKNSDAEIFRLAASEDRLQAAWDTAKDEILRKWIKEHPCTRPFIFWLLATEKRKKVSGSGGWRPGMAIDTDGLPKYWQLSWSKKTPPSFESQAVYLERHKLLSESEQIYLKQHPELLKPEKVEFDEDEDD